MSAFSQAWNLLKAIPEQRGYMGTLPQPILQMLERERAAAGEGGRGSVRHFDVEGRNTGALTGDDEGTLRTSSRPVEMGEGRGEPLPRQNIEVSRDISPLREMQETMISSRDAEQGGEFMDSGLAHTTGRVRGYDTMPEESFYVPREARLAREGTEQAIGRMYTGGQRGGRMDTMGGGSSGLNLPLRGEKDGGQVSPDLRMRRRGAERQKFGRARSATKLGNMQGVRTNAQLGGASRQFIQDREEQAPTQQERIASILSGMPGVSDIQMGAEPPAEPKPKKEMPMRQMSNRYRENLERVRQGEKPDLSNIPSSPDYANTLGMIQDPGSPESLAMRERLMQFARQQGGADGSAQQNQIDRAA